jgi:hypothetical protein
LIVCVTVLFGISASADGHGTPIGVGVDQLRLTAANGTADGAGFAPTFFADGSIDAGPEPITLPTLGDVLLYSLPGFDIRDMTPGSGLFLKPLARPVRDTTPITKRLLWYWDTAASSVSVAPHGESLYVLNADPASIQLPQAGAPIPPPINVADPLADDLGQHKHYLAYALDNSPSAAVGAYGFFARFTSPSYLESDPFLIVFNNGLSAAEVATAARAINVAAQLPGDFNHDDAVSAADYAVWKQHYGETVAPYAWGDGNGNGQVDAADYTVWRNQSGAIVTTSSAVEVATSVPEPVGFALAGVAGALVVLCRLPRRNFPVNRGRAARVA